MARKKTGTAAKKKSATLSLRITPEIKAVARRLARGGSRSLNSLVEFLIRQEAERIE
jgi:predicted HicB family RNase H-like nuclease